MRTLSEDLRRKIIVTLRRHDVVHAALFGSFAKNRAGWKSDVDFLVEFQGEKGLLDLVALKLELEDTLERNVDVVTYRALDCRIKDQVLEEQVILL